MPLTDEQQEIRDELVKRTKILVDEIPGYEKFTRQAAALDHLKTGGQQPDYDSLSDQQVADIFDAGRLNPSINGLADVDLEHRFGQINLQEKGITSNRGPESVPKGPDVPATREYMVEAIDTWMQHENNALNPRLVIQAQMGIADSPGVVLGGKLEKATFDYMHLQDAMKEAGVPEYHDPEIEANLAQLKAAEKQFNQAAKDFKAQAPNMAAKEGLEFAAQMQFTPEQVADEVRECSLLDIGNPPSINGANLSGLDLSKSDLSGLRVDAATLSKASGLEQVQGVDPELKAAAIEQHPEAVKVARVQQKVQASPAGQAAGREAPRGIPEPGKISGPDDLAGVSANEMKGAMQASETFQVKAAQGKVIGEGGESMGYAKLQVGERSKILQGQSMASKQSLVDAGFDLAALNKLSSPYNSLVDFEKKLAETKDPVLKKSYQDRIDNTWQRIDDLLEEGLANVPEQNRAQVEALLPEYKKVQIAHSGSQQADSTSRGAANALFKPETGYGQGFDESKVAEIDKTFLGRSVASYETDKLIGTDVCSEEKLAVNGEGQLMGISVAADGAQVSRISPVEIDGKNDLTTRMLRTDYASHEVQKGLYDLEALDYITGQIDRHPGNIVINPDSGSVKGIDNDLAFPEDDRANVLQRGNKAVANLPMFMHKETAEKIAAVDPEELREKLSKIEYPDNPGQPVLSPEEINGSVERLKEMQNHIKELEAKGNIVTTFDKTHYQAAVDSQMDALKSYAPNDGKLAPGESVSAENIGSIDIKCPKTSYIGAIEVARLDAEADAKNLGLSRPLDSLPNEAPRNAEYSAAKSTQAAQQQGMSPAQAREAGMHGVQKRYDDLVNKAQNQDQHIKGLQSKLEQTQVNQTAERRTLNLELQDALKQQDKNLASLEQCQKEKTAVATSLANDSAQSLEDRQKKLEAKLDHLQKNPSLTDKLKALRHGGVGGEIKQITREIDAIKQERQAVLQAEGDKIGALNHKEKAQVAALQESAAATKQEAQQSMALQEKVGMRPHQAPEPGSQEMKPLGEKYVKGEKDLPSRTTEVDGAEVSVKEKEWQRQAVNEQRSGENKPEISADQWAANEKAASTLYMNEEQREKAEVNFANKVNPSTADGTSVAVTDQDGQDLSGKNIFVMDQQGQMYAYNEKDSTTKLKEGEAPGLEGNVPDRPVHVHHSSFLAGEDVAAAGEFVVGKNTVLRDKPLSPEKAAEQGVDANLAEVPVLKEVNNRSGHYMPGAEQAQQALDQFDREGVDLDNTKFTLHRSGKGPAVVEGMAKEFMQGRATPDELAKAAGDEDRTAKLKGAGEKTFVARHEVMEELKRGQPDLKRVDRPDLPDERSTDRETINFDDEVEFDLEEEEGITEDIGEKNRVPNTEVDKPAEKQAAGKLEAQSPGYDTDDEELSFQADGYGADDIDFDEVKKDVSNKAEVKEAAPQKQQAKPDSLASDAYEADDFDLDEVKKEVSNKAEVKESARQTPTVEESAQKAKMEAAKPQDPAADLNGAGKVSTAEALGLKKVGATQNQLNGPKAGDDLASVKSTAELAGLKKVGQASLDKAELEKIALSQKEGKVGDMIKLIDKNSNSQSGPKIR